jgi:hypothetical protein
MMMKRAQAAMEFLMTYGWAILVVLVVIGALAYFGVLNPQILLPERCELQQGFYCKDYMIGDNNGANLVLPAGDNVTFTFQNGRGQGMMVTAVTVTGTGDLAAITCGGPGLTYSNCDADVLLESIDAAPCQWAGKTGLHIENGLSATVTAMCTNTDDLDGLSAGGKKKFDIAVSWYAADSTETFSHSMAGQVLANIED